MAVVLLLFALFVIVPLIEVALFIKVGGLIGILPTLALTVLTAIAGTVLARHEGLATLRLAQESLDRGEIPVAEVISGVVLLVAAVLLITPGFFTDTVGFVLMLRPVRLWLGTRAMRTILARREPGHPPGPPGEPLVIDLQATDVSPRRDR